MPGISIHIEIPVNFLICCFADIVNIVCPFFFQISPDGTELVGISLAHVIWRFQENQMNLILLAEIDQLVDPLLFFLTQRNRIIRFQILNRSVLKYRRHLSHIAEVPVNPFYRFSILKNALRI